MNLFNETDLNKFMTIWMWKMFEMNKNGYVNFKWSCVNLKLSAVFFKIFNLKFETIEKK